VLFALLPFINSPEQEFDKAGEHASRGDENSDPDGYRFRIEGQIKPSLSHMNDSDLAPVGSQLLPETKYQQCMNQ
jgi:hypothetical protein